MTNKLINGYKKYMNDKDPCHIGEIINTNINRIADKEIRIVTEYKDKISEKTIPFTLIPPPYLNPLTDISNKFDFIYRKNDKGTYFKKGDT